MSKNYQINEILSAIDSLLSDNKIKPFEKDMKTNSLLWKLVEVGTD